MGARHVEELLMQLAMASRSWACADGLMRFAKAFPALVLTAFSASGTTLASGVLRSKVAMPVDFTMFFSAFVIGFDAAFGACGALLLPGDTDGKDGAGEVAGGEFCAAGAEPFSLTD
jgi:hypothetical protein